MAKPARKKRALIIGCLVSMFFFSYGQTAKDHLSKGDHFYLKKDYESALVNYLAALQTEQNDAQTLFKAGVCYLNAEDIKNAVYYLQEAYNRNGAVDPNIHYHLAMAYQRDHQYKKAFDHFAALKAVNRSLAVLAGKKMAECAMGDSLMDIEVKVEIAPLTEINSPFAEHSPLLTADGKTLIFTSRRSSDDYQIKSATNYEDVYTSYKNGNKWSPPTKISPAINVKFNEAAVSLAPDGKTLFLYYEEGKGDIYTSFFENGDWSKPTPLNAFINHPLYRESSACVSPDGSKLYFSSNRPGGKGGLDIYVCERGANGDWGRPSNLGSTVNSRGDEDSPFLHADSVTLYFSSNGHPSLGSNDIFKTTLTDGKWTTPENLGYPINTSGYDGFFTLSPDKKTGYYSAHPGTKAANTDIYVVNFAPGTKSAAFDAADPDSLKPAESETGFIVLQGTVTDFYSAAPLSATVILVDNASKKVISKITASESGQFELVFPEPGNYGITTEKQGYLFYSMNLNVPTSGKHERMKTDVRMIKPEVGSKVVLKNIFFDVNESALKPESLSELENIENLLIQNPQWRIQINGHTDNLGDAEKNLDLSLKRAEAVVEYLIKQGVAPSRLQAKGYGSERPLVSNDDEEEGRQINRRTEIEIVE
jgi:outer membrane protein OmpA-like peptidoglycan-associated protein